MENIPHHIRQAHPNQPLHILRQITQQTQMDQSGRNNYYRLQMQQHYGAIAYSQSTGKYAWSSGYENRAAAERVALDQCLAPDAAILAWAKNGYIALALGEGKAWGAAWNENQQAAERQALQFCRQHAQSCQIVLVIHSA
jgi:hypothetical protein